MRRQIFALLIVLTFLLSGCMEQESFETRNLESVILSKDTYTTRRPVTTTAGKSSGNYDSNKSSLRIIRNEPMGF